MTGRDGKPHSRRLNKPPTQVLRAYTRSHFTRSGYTTRYRCCVCPPPPPTTQPPDRQRARRIPAQCREMTPIIPILLSRSGLVVSLLTEARMWWVAVHYWPACVSLSVGTYYTHKAKRTNDDDQHTRARVHESILNEKKTPRSGHKKQTIRARHLTSCVPTTQ